MSKALSGLTPNTTYYYRAVGQNSAGTTNGANITFSTDALAPTVTTRTETGVSETDATLKGTVNANNDSTTVTFEYGLTTAYGTTVTADQSPVTGTTDTPVSKALSGLTPNTTYYYRAVGQNSVGTTNGANITFSTDAPAPTVTTNAASEISIKSTTLNGTVNANNDSTTITFEYGLTTAYGTTVTADQSPVTGITDTTVSKTLSGLTPNTTYHYRAIGQSSVGISNGADITFTTDKIPSVLFGSNTSPKDNAIITTRPTKITVEFNQNVKGDGSPEAADNIINYLLVEIGENETFDTVACAAEVNGGIQPDDIQIPINTATYNNSNPFISTLSINNNTPLPIGKYRLLICGTSSIENLLDVKLNNGLSDSQLNFTVQAAASTLPETGFRHGRVTALPEQPTAKAYKETAMMLEIPALDVSMPIVGVPQSDSGWDVNWLGNSAGYLAGSAFPTWAGNTVITGHVWDAYNNPGIFSDLKTLTYGDQVQIKAWGLTYTYEVRESNLVTTKNVNAVLQSEEFDWVTLVTCEFYNPFSGDYLFRRSVRAVLVSVK